MILERREINKMSPMIVLAYYLERVSRLQYREGGRAPWSH